MVEQATETVYAIDNQAEYHDGMITFPAYLYELLKQGLGVDFKPEYLDAQIQR